jgi:hypothetical protein
MVNAQALPGAQSVRIVTDAGYRGHNAPKTYANRDYTSCQSACASSGRMAGAGPKRCDPYIALAKAGKVSLQISCASYGDPLY